MHITPILPYDASLLVPDRRGQLFYDKLWHHDARLEDSPSDDLKTKRGDLANIFKMNKSNEQQKKKKKKEERSDETKGIKKRKKERNNE